jgi:ferrous iron transport protein B
MRVPRLSNILIKVLARTEWYLKEAVPLFIVGTLLLYLLDVTRLLQLLQRAMAPLVVGALGLPAEAANAFVIGFLRRDYGAAGLFDMAKDSILSVQQLIVSMIVMTLFVPCIANFFVMIKEQGLKKALAILAFITPFAIFSGTRFTGSSGHRAANSS